MADQAKQCFVISPIGEEGSPTREHADDVLDFIIRPAVESLGIKAVRSDRVTDAGRITDQMFKAILDYTFCVAVLTDSNPNVFYELAVAQMARKPVIILMQKGHELPFDIRDLRCVYYDLTPRSLHEQRYAREMVEHITSLESSGWRGTSPVDALGYELGAADYAAQLRFFDRSESWGTSDDWMALLNQTEKVFEIMGIDLSSWKSSILGKRGFERTVLEKAQGGCQVRFLVMDTENPALRELINDEIERDSFEQIVTRIKEMAQFFKELDDLHQNIGVRQMRRGCPHFQSARTDQHGICIPYMYSSRAGFSPLLQCSSEHALYGRLEQEFSSLWETNVPPAVFAV